MQINIEEFKDVLKKATINFSLDSVQLVVTADKIKSKMTTNSNDAVVVLDIENKVMPGNAGELQFNFQDPNQSLLPYLGLIEEGQETDINIKPEKIVLTTGNLKSNIFFCSPQVVSVFGREGVRPGTTYFTEFALNDDFIRQFNMVKKIGMRFGKIYFGVSSNIMVMETTDKTNRFSNGLKFELYRQKFENMSLCFDYKNLTNVMSSIGDDYSDFILHVTYMKEADLGMIYLCKNDESEKYFLMSKQDL